jgi:hypothetical protein
MPDAPSPTTTAPPFRRLVVFVPLTGDGKAGAISDESTAPSLASSPAP